MRFIELQEVYYPRNYGAYEIRPMTFNVEEISNVTKLSIRNTVAKSIVSMKNGKSYKVLNDYKYIMSMIENADAAGIENE